jgi:serine/threonine protein kinase
MIGGGRLAAGRRLGHYEIFWPIGAGGMGEVYRARDSRLHRDVALKVLPPALVADPARRARFVQEARAASALEHQHIAVIHEIGDDADVAFIAMELVRGEPLSDVVARGPMTPERALDLASEIAEGLVRAREIGIVHRDLKPANVMVTDQGHAKIIDFGLAKLAEPQGPDSAIETMARHQTEAVSSSGPHRTCRRSRHAARLSITGATCSASGSCCTSCWQGARHSARRRGSTRCTQFCTTRWLRFPPDRQSPPTQSHDAVAPPARALLSARALVRARLDGR